MSTSVLAARFTPNLASIVSQFLGMPFVFESAMTRAQEESADILISSMQGNMAWENPTGALEASLASRPTGVPFETMVGPDTPYDRRREYGFSGMTDSLGRYYANDPGKPYVEPAFTENVEIVGGIYSNELDAAIQVED